MFDQFKDKRIWFPILGKDEMGLIGIERSRWTGLREEAWDYLPGSLEEGRYLHKVASAVKYQQVIWARQRSPPGSDLPLVWGVYQEIGLGL